MDKYDGFNQSHTLAYSLIGLQELNLAYRFPIIYWNTACLITDAGGVINNEETEDEEKEVIIEENFDNEIEEFGEDEEEDEEAEEEEKASNKKKKQSSTNYGKIATAIGKFKHNGINISHPSINRSDYTFSPDPIEQTIRFGLSGIVKIGRDLVEKIINNRPYISITDFTNKVKINKTQVINLIKCGAFDEFGDRYELMKEYVMSISDTKSTLNLRNLQLLINLNLIPEKFEHQIKSFNYNKYLKKFKSDNYYLLDNISFKAADKYFDLDNLIPNNNAESGYAIKQNVWDNIYKKEQNILRPYIKENEKELLEKVNNLAIKENWEKYCMGNISKWEMDSICCYSSNHELEFVDEYEYGWSDYSKLSENSEIDKIITIKGKHVPLFKIHRIAGTILDKNKDKKLVTLLTTSGVVTVRIFGDVFKNYDKQISEVGADGKKHIIEKSWLSRGNKIIVSGIRRGDEFSAKKYSKTPWHLIELIEEIKEDGSLITRTERVV